MKQTHHTEPYADEASLDIIPVDVNHCSYVEDSDMATVGSPLGDYLGVEGEDPEDDDGCLLPLWIILLGFTVLVVMVSVTSVIVHQTIVRNNLLDNERDSNKHNLETVIKLGDATMMTLIASNFDMMSEMSILRLMNDVNTVVYPVQMLNYELAQSISENTLPEFLSNLRRRFLSTAGFRSPFRELLLTLTDGTYATLSPVNTPWPGSCVLSCGTLVPHLWTGSDDLSCNSSCTCLSNGVLQCAQVSSPCDELCNNTGMVMWTYRNGTEATATREVWKRIDGSQPERSAVVPADDLRTSSWYTTIPQNRVGHFTWLQPTFDGIPFHAGFHSFDGDFTAGIKATIGGTLVSLNVRRYLPTQNSVLWMVGDGFNLLTYSGTTGYAGETMATLHLRDPTDWAASLLKQVSGYSAARFNETEQQYMASRDFTTLATNGMVSLNLTGGSQDLLDTNLTLSWYYSAEVMTVEYVTSKLVMCALVPDLDLVGQWKKNKIDIAEAVKNQVSSNEDRESRDNFIAGIICGCVLLMAILLSLGFSRVISRHVSNMGKQFEMINIESSDVQVTPTKPIFVEMHRTHKLFLSVIRHIRDLRSFIPQAVLDLEVNPQSGTQHTLASESTDGWNDEVPSCDDGLILTRQASIQKLKLGLKPRKATLMSVKADLYDMVSGQYDAADPTGFIEKVLKSLKEFDGVVLSISANSILGTWNAHSSYPAHAEQACHCALKIAHDLLPLKAPWWGIVLASGKVLVGHVGNNERRAPAVLGSPLSLLNSLVYLTAILKSRILISEATYELAQNKILARPVDVVPADPNVFFNDSKNLHPFQPQLRDTKVYELLHSGGGGNFQNTNKYVSYVEAFNCFWKHSYAEALVKLRIHLEENGKDVQALRLLHLTEVASKNDLLLPDPYVRRPFMWEDFLVNAKSEIPEPIIDDSDSDPILSARCFTGPQNGNHAQTQNTLINGGQSSGAFTNVSFQHNNAASTLRKELLREVEKAGDSDSSSDEQHEPPMSWRDEMGSVWWRSQNSIGKGAFGEVWQAMGQDGSFVAVKVLSLAKFRHSSPVSALRSPARNSKLPRRYSTDSSVDMGASISASRRPVATFAPNIPETPAYVRPAPRLGRKMSSSSDDNMAPVSSFSIAQQATNLKLSMNSNEYPAEEECEAFDEIIKEVAVLSEIRHDNIVAYTSSTVVNGFVMICMEYVGGGSIYDLIKRFGNLPVCSVKRYLKDTCCGLEHLHHCGVVHCDVKPHNILLSCSGQCKLADFGASTKQRPGCKGQALGSPLYMAPEACRGVINSASDIWGLGITATEMLTGEIPYKSKFFNPFFFMQRLKQGPENGPDLTLLNEEMDTLTVEFVKQCLEYEPEKRPTAKQLCMHQWFDIMQEMPASVGGTPRYDAGL